MNRSQANLKRSFDIIASLFGLLIFSVFILVLVLVASIETRELGIFRQIRVGQYGNLFKVMKIRTMRNIPDLNTTITASNDIRITKFGGFMRRWKIDELPQLLNVLFGEMSIVGPRPDVPGYADNLKGENRIILKIKPGITGPASIYFKNEEELLANQKDPEHFNRTVIWPQKIELNKRYIKEYSFFSDLKYIAKTITG